MRTLERRILAIETATRRTLGTRHFWGYEATGKFYECGYRPDYRRGLNGDDGEDGPAYTRADIAALEAAGWECSVITIVFVDWSSTKYTGV